jgi:hypothetical protein
MADFAGCLDRFECMEAGEGRDFPMKSPFAFTNLRCQNLSAVREAPT